MPASSQHAFAEKVALITDGNNPIGRATALQLALYGSYVIVGFSEASKSEKQVFDELKSLGTLQNAVEYDFSSVKGAKRLIDEVEKVYGRLDLLVNCLKFEADSEFENTTESLFDETFNRNFKSTFFVTQAAMRLLKERPKPRIVNVISACDTDAQKSNISYAAVNNALEGMARSLADVLPEKFRVNGVAVSGKEKKRSKHDILDEELFRAEKGLDADDAARAIVYLLSSEAVGINGQVLKVS